MTRLRFLSSALAVGMILAACASAPEGPPADLVVAEALAAPDPYEGEATLTSLLSRGDLTVDERAEALYQRAHLRRFSTDKLTGAQEDLNAMLSLAPEHARAGEAKRALAVTEEAVEAHEDRLTYMLTLSQWFDSAWALGRHEQAALRYKKSQLSPTPEQVIKLTRAGFLCPAETGQGPDLYQLGVPRDDLENVRWCEAMPEAVTQTAEATQNP